MILACHIGLYWSRCYLISEDPFSFKSCVIPLTPGILVKEYPKEVIINEALKRLGDPKGDLKTYIISSNPKLKSDATFEEALEKLPDTLSYIWVGDEGAVEQSEYYNQFALETSPQGAENALANRQIYGPRISSFDYEKSLESAITFVKIKETVLKSYQTVLKNNENIVLTGVYPLFSDNIAKLFSPILAAINYPGFWSFSLDLEGLFSLYVILNYFETSLLEKALSTFEFPKTASVFVLPNAREVEAKFASGGSQNFKMGEFGVINIPISQNEEVTLVIKGKKTITQSITGGKYGAIIDSRARPLAKVISKMQTLKQVEELAKVLETKI